MGMDVYGLNPKSEVGQYFRRNVWGWHPLWQYVEMVHPEIAELVEFAHSNDGDGLDEEKSGLLAAYIHNDLATGVVDNFIAARNQHLAELPLEECKICNGTGIRTDAIGVEMGMPDKELSVEVASMVERDKGYCNGCSGYGKTSSWETNYYLDRDDLVEFQKFLADCGGFEIC